MSSLIIISPFIPAQTPNTLRWNAIIRELTKKDYGLHVLTTNAGSAESIKGNSDQLVFRAGYHTLHDLYVHLTGKVHKRNIPGLKDVTPVIRNSFVNKLVDKTWRQWYWPDGTMLFVKPGIKMADKLYDRFHYKNLISVGLPFSCHLIARSIKERHPEINWLMDIQDPFSFSKRFRVNNDRRYADRNKREELKAFELADSIVLNNIKALESYNCLFPGFHDKLHVIAPLLEIDSTPSVQLNESSGYSITLAYYGSFYENVRSPEGFLKLAENLRLERPDVFNRMKCYFIGEQTEYSLNIFKQYPKLSSMIEFVPLIERQDLYAFLQRVSVLLNFGNTTDFHLPSKVVEFLYFQKPLVNFINRTDDTTAAFLENKIDILNVNVEESGLEKVAQSFIEFVQIERMQTAYSNEAVERYGAKSIAEAYEDLLS